MNINRVMPSGFCKGVVNAINIVKKTKEENPNEDIYILGMIVHNSFVNNQMKKLGVITLDDTNKSKEELIDEIDHGIVIFTAHGISDQIKKKVIDKGLKYVDASCEDVLKTKNIILDYLSNGYDVIYFGKANHPEASAILSISDKIHLVTNAKDIANLNINNDKILLTSQTTMSLLDLKDLITSIKEKYPTVTIIDEICHATSSRQEAILNLKDADILYVVGDIKSNNTNKLVEVAKNNGIKKVFLINDYKDIKLKDLEGLNNVYVTAGASTPIELINEVIDYLKANS